MRRRRRRLCSIAAGLEGSVAWTDYVLETEQCHKREWEYNFDAILGCNLKFKFE